MDRLQETIDALRKSALPPEPKPRPEPKPINWKIPPPRIDPALRGPHWPVVKYTLWFSAFLLVVALVLLSLGAGSSIVLCGVFLGPLMNLVAYFVRYANTTDARLDRLEQALRDLHDAVQPEREEAAESTGSLST